MTCDEENVLQAPSPEQLIELADRILLSAAAMDDVVEDIEGYSSAFENWYDENAALFSDDPGCEAKLSMDENEIEQLRTLLSKHEQVLEKAQSLKDATARQIRDHRTKGKGIMAYLDRLPRAVSSRKPKKG